MRVGGGLATLLWVGVLTDCGGLRAWGGESSRAGAERPSATVADPSAKEATTFSWSALPDLPDALGVAGPVAGVSGDALVVAGGANFPGGFPWAGGKKVWHDAAFILPAGATNWLSGQKLPHPLAYAVSLTTPRGILVAGGSDADRHYADCFLLRWNGSRLETEPLPPLPLPVANAAGAIAGDTVFVAGGETAPGATAAITNVWMLNLSGTAAWMPLPAWPGPARSLAAGGAQAGQFVLVGGVALSADEAGKPRRSYLRDAYAWSPKTRAWRSLARAPYPIAAAPAPLPAVGASHLFVMGCDDGSRYGFEPALEHPGFNPGLLAYDLVTDTWARFASLPCARVTVPAVTWNGSLVVPSGEMRPGVRSPNVRAYASVRNRRAFGWLNYATFALYPVLMLGIAWRVGRKGSSEEFFRGGQHIPWWAAGISIYATMLSSLTFMSIPAKAYATDWAFSLGILTLAPLAPIIIRYYLPFFRQLNITSAYEYLERRFNLGARWFGSLSFILFQLGRTAIVLYLPALALATVSNFAMEWCILIVGGICILMTFEGGLESVVWTDVAQTIMLLAGAFAVLFFALRDTPGGLAGMVKVAHEQNKLFGGLRWDWDLTVATGWVVLVGNLFTNLASYTTGQDVVQRFVATKDSRQAAKSIWTNALMCLPSTALFFAAGTALFAFYSAHPERLDPTLTKSDQVFPLFIVNELPMGFAGLVVAAIFAAAQPTSSLNSIATAWVVDFQARLKPATSDLARLRTAKVVTVLSGLVGGGCALLMTRLDIYNAWDAFLGLQGMAVSALAGLFALGIFTRRTHGRGALLGALLSVVVMLSLKWHSPLHFLAYSAVGFLVCVAGGYLLSLVLAARPRDLTGLTVFTMQGVDRPGT